MTAGAAITRTQTTGSEPDGGMGITQFRPDFGRDAITNLRLGTPTSYVLAIGSTYRAFPELGHERLCRRSLVRDSLAHTDRGRQLGPDYQAEGRHRDAPT